MRRELKHMMTGEDNETYDVGRVLALFGGLTFICIGIRMAFIVTASAPFDFQSFGIGFGSMAGGIGALLKLKENTEPSCPVPRPKE